MAIDDPMTGAEFQREVGTDAEKWAARFIREYAAAAVLRSDEERALFVADWFRDYADAAMKAAKEDPIA